MEEQRKKEIKDGIENMSKQNWMHPYKNEPKAEQQIIGYLAKPFGWYITAAHKLELADNFDNSCNFRAGSDKHKKAIQLGILEEWFNPIYEEYNQQTTELKSILTDFKANNIQQKEAVELITKLYK